MSALTFNNYAALAMLSCSASVLSCGDCDFERKRVEDFLANPDNLECKTDADCRVVDVNCLEVEGAFCGQVVLSKQASESITWSDLRDALRDCVDVNSCSVCSALLIATCHNGSCG